MEKIIILVAVLMILRVIFPLIVGEFKYSNDWGERELDYCLKVHMERNRSFELTNCMDCDAYKRGRCLGVKEFG